MTLKEKMIETVQRLPENASIEDAVEQLILLSKIEKGIEQADDGLTMPHDEIKGRMAKWLK